MRRFQSNKHLKNAMVPSMGYRYQEKQGVIIVKAGTTAIINMDPVAHSYSPWIDLGIGYNF